MQARNSQYAHLQEDWPLHAFLHRRKKELAKAELRLRVADAKVEAVRHWGRIAEQAFREFQARLAQFVSILDGDLPKAVATLEQLLVSLDRYFAAQAPAVAPRSMAESDEPRPTAITDTENSAAMPTDADHAPEPGLGEASVAAADEHAVDPQRSEPAEALAREES
jgi:ATP/maltotriose-dependent transcriptional regulator MalT